MKSSNSEQERIHERKLNELLAELRVVFPGVTVLFAFLLTVPFSAKFPDLTNSDRLAYLVAFTCSAISIVLLLGPAAYHRLMGDHYDKGLMLRSATRQVVVGTMLLGISLGAVVLLVVDILYPGNLATALAVGLVISMVALWVAFPLYRRYRSRSDFSSPNQA